MTKTARLPFLVLTLADAACLIAAVWEFARAGAFVFTFLAQRTIDAAQWFSFDDSGFSALFLVTPLSSLLLYCLLPISAFGFLRRRPWVKWVVLAQLPLRLAAGVPTIPVIEEAAAGLLTVPLPALCQAAAATSLLILAEAGKAAWVVCLTRR